MLMNRIKELREKKGLSQDKLAKQLAVNLRTLQRWENDETAIRKKNAKKLADYFNVSESYLLGYSEIIPSEETSSIFRNGVSDVEAVEPIYLLTESIGLENKDILVNFLRNEFILEYNEFKDIINEPYATFIERVTLSSIHNLWELPKTLVDLIAYWSLLSDKQRDNLFETIKDLANSKID